MSGEKKRNLKNHSKKKSNTGENSVLVNEEFASELNDQDERGRETAEQEEEWLDPNCAFVAAALKKTKREQSAKCLPPMVLNEDEQRAVMAVTDIVKEGRMAMREGNYFEAINLLSNAIRLDHISWRLYCYRSTCYYMLQEYTKALEDADNAISIEPKEANCYYRRALALTGLKLYEQAEYSYEQVIKIDDSFLNVAEELLSFRVNRLKEMGFSSPDAYTVMIESNSLQEAVDKLTRGSEEPKNSDDEIYVSDEEIYGSSGDRCEPQVQEHDYQHQRCRDPSNPDGHSFLWAENIPRKFSNEELKKMFSEYGQVRRLKRCRNNTCAYIFFEDKSSPGVALYHLQGKKLGANVLDIAYPTNERHWELFGYNIPTISGGWQHRVPMKEGECYFWRTTGCDFGTRCRYLHIKENEGID